MSAPLDSRVVRIVRWLIDQSTPRSTSELATDLVLSERAVRYRMSAVRNYLRSHDAELVSKSGIGLVVVAGQEVRAAIVADLDGRSSAPGVYSPAEREHLLLDALLWSYPDSISLDDLNVGLEVSKTSVRRDLRRCEPWLERMGLPVVRKAGEGIGLEGSEQQVRRVLVQLILKAVPDDVLEELVSTSIDDASLVRVRVPAGIRDRLSSLPIQASARALRDTSLHERLTSEKSDLLYTLYLAVTKARVDQGCNIEDAVGELRSRDDGSAEVVRSLTEMLESLGCSSLSEQEVTVLTDYLLGLEALVADTPVPKDYENLATELLNVATTRLQTNFVADDALHRSLSIHLNRLSVRHRYGIPAQNPLTSQVADQYPEVYAVAEELRVIVDEQLGTSTDADEVAFLTMYLAGCIERRHVRKPKRAMVICPTGRATSWMLVSRLCAEFPELPLVEVNAVELNREQDMSEVDLVISTTALDDIGVPVVVVSPLLPFSDVRAVAVFV